MKPAFFKSKGGAGRLHMAIPLLTPFVLDLRGLESPSGQLGQSTCRLV